MKTVNVHEAKTHLSRLLRRANAGEEIVIAKGGVPYARLVPLSRRAPKRQRGTLKGQITVGDAFFEPLPDDWTGDLKVSSLLLDTHALLWWANDDRLLSKRIRQLIEDDDTAVFVSAASAWEIATKVRLGKLEWPATESVEEYCTGQGFTLLPVSFAHGEQAGSWSVDHGDPFDRMLAAQSQIEDLPLATNDPKLKLFGVEVLW